MTTDASDNRTKVKTLSLHFSKDHSLAEISPQKSLYYIQILKRRFLKGSTLEESIELSTTKANKRVSVRLPLSISGMETERAYS